MLKKLICLSSFIFILIFFIICVFFSISKQASTILYNHLIFSRAIAQTAEPSPTDAEQNQLPESEQDPDPEQDQNDSEQNRPPDSEHWQETGLEAKEPAATASPSAQPPEPKQTASAAAETKKTQLAAAEANDNQDNFNYQLQQLFTNIESLSKQIDQLQYRPQKISADLPDPPDEIIIQDSGFYIKHNSPSAIIAVMLGGACLLATGLLIKPLS